MAQPTPYNRLYDFSDYQEVNPTKPLRGSEVDAELDAIKLTTDQIRANAALIQRDDGKLANQSVTPESLEAGTLALISQGEYNPRGAWAGSTAYGLGDVVTFNAATYLCIVAHTSVTQFANDLAANKWLLIANGALAGGGQAVDLFEGTGSQTVFTLSFTYNGNNAAVVFVAGVAQIPGQDFTISGTTLTFVSAPPTPAVAGRKNVMVRGTGIEAQLAADGAATAAANASASATAAANSATAASASQTAAATSATNAANSATAAAGSASTASTQATTATTQATNAANSATAAAGSQSAAATSATNAANSATAAAGSATTATTQATTATNQATAAANSATAASNSATAAAGSASTASGAATTATTQATAASTSATAASTSATNAANSASQAATSASNAAASASSASSSASSANTSAVNAATSATNASNSATAAGNSAAAASTSATNAANSATTATTQATNASNSATAAAGSASAAAASAASAAAALDSFDDRYLGPKTSDPTVDNDGNALVTGALYYRTTAPIGMKVYDGNQWIEASAAQQASLVTFEYVATAGQTTFSGADANGVTLSYTVGNVFVSVNGSRIRPGDDFTATTGTSVVLLVAATAGDEIIIDAFRTFDVANTYTQAQVDAAFLPKANPSYTGTLTGGTGVVNFGSGQFYKDASGNVAIGTVTPAGTGLTLGSGKDLWLEATGYSTWKQTNYQGAYYWNNGVDRLALTGSGHLGLGTVVVAPSGVNKFIAIGDADSGIGQISDGVLGLYSNGVLRLRVDATGATQSYQKFQVITQAASNGDFANRTLYLEDNLAGTNAPAIGFHAPNNGQAGILKFWGGSGEFEFRNSTDTTFASCRASAFNVSSDYRLKEDIQPMGGALQRVIKLRPVTYKWKDGGKPGQGFIAHELAEVFPDAVTGEKDGVDAFDNPIYQGIDTSFLVATLTAAIQEQQAIIEQLKADVAALKGAA